MENYVTRLKKERLTEESLKCLISKIQISEIKGVR